MRGTVVPFSLAWLAAAAVVGGCSLFDGVGGGGLSFDLPVATFKVDPNDPRWWPSPPKGVPAVVCRGPAALVTDCCQPPAPMSAVDCQAYPLTCGDDGMCSLTFDYDDAVEIDLGRDVPALQHRRGWVLAQATLAAIDTRVFAHVTRAGTDQTVGGVDTLPLRTASLYVAPQGADSARAPGAVFLAGIPLGSEDSHVDLAPGARLALSAFLTDFNTPFTLMLSTHVVVGSEAVPKAVAQVEVAGQVDASF
jgi:hypothetical protein